MANREMVVDGIKISDNDDMYVIAEIGQNHEGDVQKCKDLFDAAKAAGAQNRTSAPQGSGRETEVSKSEIGIPHTKRRSFRRRLYVTTQHPSQFARVHDHTNVQSLHRR